MTGLDRNSKGGEYQQMPMDQGRGWMFNTVAETDEVNNGTAETDNQRQP